jgi:hypothetical protein
MKTPIYGGFVLKPLYIVVGKEGVEPSRLAAHDPKSCLSANSSTSPVLDVGDYISLEIEVQDK